MGLKYMDSRVAVFHGIFRGLRVRDLKTGNVIDPSLHLKANTLKTWSALPRVRFSSRRARQLAEIALFGDCGWAAVVPDDQRAFNILHLDVQSLVDVYWREGELAALRESPV
jgi:hypothetical protein